MTLVIGIGNRDRGDDAAGLMVTDRLRGAVSQRVSVMQFDGDSTRALVEMAAVEHVVIVDAMPSTGHPGRMHRLDVTQDGDVAAYRGSSTHGLGAGDVIQLARALGTLPRKTVVYGIEGKDFELGHGLTRCVDEAIPIVVARILEEVG